MSIANVLITHYSTKSGYNCSSKLYKNVKAVQISGKNFSKFFSSVAIEGDIGEAVKHYFKIPKINDAISSKALHCFVRSYLHLLQLF